MPATDRPIARSWLYVPSHKDRMIEKSLGLPADAVIYDLEDAVPIAEKQAARDTLSRSLRPAQPNGSPRRYVRLNHPDHRALFEDDLACALGLGVEGIALPKIETPQQVRHVDGALREREADAGIVAGSTRIMLLIESPLGLVNAHAIACSSGRIVAVSFGAEDFSREMGLPLVRTAEDRELLYARSALAIAAAAAGVQAVDVIWTELSDLEGLAAEARQARRLGYTGKAAIHPAQLDPINAAFSPTAAEVAYAREVVDAYDHAVGEGTGAISHRGTFLEEPVVARARRTIELAERLG